MAERLATFDAAFLLVAVMVIAHVFRRHDVLAGLYGRLQRRVRNRRVLLAAMAAVLGVLPIPGRISVTSALLETLRAPGRRSPQLGVVAYVATHHYYLWSPMEKSVVIALAGLGISYAAFVRMMAWPLAIVLAVCFGYIFLWVRDEDLAAVAGDTPVSRGNVLDVTLFLGGFGAAIAGVNAALVFGALALFYVLEHGVPWREALRAVDWRMVAAVVAVILLGMWVQTHADAIQERMRAWFGGRGVPVLAAGAVTFGLSLLLGSSSRYAAIAVLASLIYGIETFVFFFLVDYAGYLLSPTHKCVWIGKMYFDTPLLAFYRVIAVLALLMVGYGLFDLQ